MDELLVFMEEIMELRVASGVHISKLTESPPCMKHVDDERVIKMYT